MGEGTEAPPRSASILLGEYFYTLSNDGRGFGAKSGIQSRLRVTQSLAMDPCANCSSSLGLSKRGFRTQGMRPRRHLTDSHGECSVGFCSRRGSPRVLSAEEGGKSTTDHDRVLSREFSESEPQASACLPRPKPQYFAQSLPSTPLPWSHCSLPEADPTCAGTANSACSAVTA